ncbi:MAG: hypothetical protein L3J78_04550, partial [Thermoplasmata archaeon]|nr:hypothetical protein [Thermoplasmata archaeon]
MAMIARKRCDLECIVAGTKESQDVRTARGANLYFDYRTEVVELDAVTSRRIYERLAGTHPRLNRIERVSLIPTLAALEGRTNAPGFAGFASSRMGDAMTETLRAADVRLPLQEVSVLSPVTRA